MSLLPGPVTARLESERPPAAVRPTRKGTLRRLARRPLAVGPALVLTGIVVAAAAAPLVAPYGPLASDLFQVRSGPSAAHLLGTDDLGRDILSRLIYGARSTLVSSLEAVAVTLVLGVAAGLFAGYRGGRVDTAISRIGDLLLSIPNFMFLLVILAVFPKDVFASMIALGVLFSPGLMRVVRSTALAVRQELYVDAARAAGMSDARIVATEILPRVTGPIIVQSSLLAGLAILVTTGLAYLGFGVQLPQPSWGNMLSEAAQNIQNDPWMIIPPGVAIGLTVLSLGLLGDALRDVLAERWGAARPARSRRQRRGRRRPTIEPVPAVPAAAEGMPEASEGPPAPASLLELRGVSIAIGTGDDEVVVASNVTFSIESGEAVGLVGESGCGKTVTARSILGLLPPAGRVAGGEICFDGRAVSKFSAREIQRLRGSEIGLVLQEPMASLEPTTPVGTMLARIVRLHGRCDRASARRRAVELLGRVHLPDPELVARRYPYELSGGMAQRVAIAIALAGRPRLLIADEPTTALDVTVQAEILSLFRSLQEELGLAVLIVTHDWGVVADLCQKVVVMYAGQVVERGTVGELFERPLHPYSEALLASIPERARRGVALPAIRGVVPPPRAWSASCRFADRCDYAEPDCREAPVPIVPVGERLVRCIHSGRVGEETARVGADIRGAR